MTKRILVVAFITTLMLACYPLVAPVRSPTLTRQPPTTLPRDAPFDLVWDDRSLFLAGLVTSYQNVLNTLPGASIYHISFNISDPPTRVSGLEEVRYTNQESVSLTEVDFAIFSEILGGAITINNVLLNTQPVTVTHQNGLLRLPLIKLLQPGDSVIIHMEFEINVPTRGGDFYYGIFGYNEGILSLAQAYPTILVYNEQGWNNQTPDLDGDPLFSDASFYLVSVDAPSDLVLVATGTEVSRSNSADRQRVLYADGPARDFYLAASTSFIKQSETVGELTVNSFAPANLDQPAQAALKVAEVAIADFSQRYASYPYTEFDIVPIVTSAGGVEFPGLTSVALDAYNSPEFLEIVVVHEVGHQWFYNLVGDSTQGQPWLDESIAEFVTWQYYLDRYGAQKAQSFRDELQATWGMLSDQAIPLGLPVSAYTSDGYVAIVYGRGPLFLLALRDRMGQETFDRFMHDYTRPYEWMIATTDGFKQLAEQDCACNLTPLFNAWVYSK